MSAEGDVKRHHHEKASDEGERARVAVFGEMGGRDQFLHDDVDHGARREGQKPGHRGRDGGDDADALADARVMARVTPV